MNIPLILGCIVGVVWGWYTAKLQSDVHDLRIDNEALYNINSRLMKENRDKRFARFQEQFADRLDEDTKP